MFTWAFLNTQVGFLQSRQRFASAIAISLVKPCRQGGSLVRALPLSAVRADVWNVATVYLWHAPSSPRKPDGLFFLGECRLPDVREVVVPVNLVASKSGTVNTSNLVSPPTQHAKSKLHILVPSTRLSSGSDDRCVVLPAVRGELHH